MKNQKGQIVLVIMLVVAAVALLVAFLAIRQRSQNPPSAATPTSTDNSTNPTSDQTGSTPNTLNQTGSLAGWQTYVNSKYGFQLQYPPNLKVGTVSGNSVLGTYSAPIMGFHVGPLVLVVLRNASLKKIGSDYFNGFYNQTSCTISKITNAQVSSIKSASCTGESGVEKYAYIQGPSYDVFVDGYSKGYDTQDFGGLTKATDFVNILSTFNFGKTSQNTTNVPEPFSSEPASNSIQAFSINADDSGAIPSQITVPAGTIVEITFNVSSSNVNHGGLDFRSSVVNSGTVLSAQSKTISFTASQSFVLTPYWPATNIATGYTINVIVQ